MRLGRWPAAVVTASVASVPFTYTHSNEDLSLGFAERLGIPFLAVALFLSLAYAAQVLAAALASRGDWRGYTLNAALAVIWLSGAVVEHLGELLFVWPYRQGWISKGLIVGLMASVAVWAVVSILAVRRAIAPGPEAVRGTVPSGEAPATRATFR